MGETLNWSPGLLYKEEATTHPHVCLRYPSRLHSAGFLVLTALCGIGLVSCYFIDRGNGLWLGVNGGFTLLMATTAVLAIWDQRLVTIDRATREITYLRRTPFRLRRDFVQAAHLREVLVEERHDHESGPAYRVFLIRMNGDLIFLGSDQEEDATILGRRLSELLKIPLETQSSDNLRRV
jgi:hypothetical protein